MTSSGKRLNVFKFREIKFGIIMLIFAVTLSLVSMYPLQKEFTLSGVLNEGDEISMDEVLPSGELVNGSLTLKSSHSEVLITTNENTSMETLTGEKDLKLRKFGMYLKVLRGDLNYEIHAWIITYPFSYLGYLAMLFMISGAIIVNIGLLKIFSEKI